MLFLVSFWYIVPAGHDSALCEMQNFVKLFTHGPIKGRLFAEKWQAQVSSDDL
jgi:hypothetical protein